MRSNRVPWVRGGLLSFVPLVLPLVWVVEVDSCGANPRSSELTGLALVKNLDLEAWVLVVPPLLICLSAPFVARALGTAVLRLAVHFIGLLATGFCAYAALVVLTFSLFAHRDLRPPGAAVLIAFFASFAEASWRFGWSIQEWLADRRGTRGAPP